MTPKNRTVDQPFTIQAAAAQYYSPRYLSPKRLSSIGWQFRLCSQTSAESFVEIGSGNHLLAWMLRKNGKCVWTIDHNPDLEPDIVGLLPRLPIPDRSFDVSLCFQVLEHMPFDMLADCLGDLARISRQWVIMSVPDQTQPVLPISWRRRLTKTWWRIFHYPPRWRITPPQSIPLNEEHFWEIGHAGITATDIIAVATSQGLETTHHFRNQLNEYHHFFTFRRAVVKPVPVQPETGESHATR